jgi:hypothetical protein
MFYSCDPDSIFLKIWPRMSAQQLCFFKFERPLLDLLGVDFFRSAPAKPGVYLFLGEGKRVLYVGQSKNLRSRLSYYKNAQPEREPRRIIRLVHQTRSIELQVCETPTAAQAREVELIQEHRPRFNVQHALSRTYSFFAIRSVGKEMRIRLSLEENGQPEERLVGAFKNRSLCRRGLFALGRTLWSEGHKPKSIFDFPMALLDRHKTNQVTLPEEKPVEPLLCGESSDFLLRTQDLLEREREPFLKKIFESDFATLTELFELAVRMRGLRERSGASGLLPQTQIDRVRFAQEI